MLYIDEGETERTCKFKACGKKNMGSAKNRVHLISSEASLISVGIAKSFHREMQSEHWKTGEYMPPTFIPLSVPFVDKIAKDIVERKMCFFFMINI